MPNPSKKKLVYILNSLKETESQHFFHVLGLLKYLQDHYGWEVKLLSEKGGVGTKTISGIDVQYMSENGRFSRLFFLAGRLISLRRDGFRLVFARISLPATITSIVCSIFTRTRTLFWQSSANHDLDRGKPFLARCLHTVMLSFVIAFVTRFVTGPEYMIRYYRDVYKVPVRKLLLLYNDVDTTRFSPRATSNLSPHLLRVVFVHSLSPSKAASFYLPAIISQLGLVASGGTTIELDLIGEGPERDQIAEQIASPPQGVSVRLLGSVPNTQIPDHLARADVFIMPSYREGMPRALLEAMASGLPAVATDAGGTRDLVGPLQLEFIVSRDDPESFARKLADLLSDADMRAAISLENIAQVRRYSTPVVAEMYDRELGRLL